MNAIMANGAGKPMATLGEISGASPIPGNRPKAWSTALELCMKAADLTPKQVIMACGFKAEEVSTADVKRWILGRTWPTLHQCNKLRAGIPLIRAYEDLLRLELREDPKRPKAPPKPAVVPEKWSGPPIKGFNEGLRYLRMRRGMTQGAAGKVIGVDAGTFCKWEKHEDVTMIQEVYEKLCALFPGLEFAPKPEFSLRYKNQFKRENALDAEHRRMENARAVREIEAQADKPIAPVTKAPVVADRASLNAASAAYGIARGDLMALEAEVGALEVRHKTEEAELQARLLAAQTRVNEEQERVKVEAARLHA